jgi:hypothetical protein
MKTVKPRGEDRRGVRTKLRRSNDDIDLCSVSTGLQQRKHEPRSAMIQNVTWTSNITVPMMISVIGGIITAVGTFWTEGKERRLGWITLHKRLIASIGIVIAVVGTFWASFLQTKSQRQLRELSNDIINSLTGGDSIPIVVFTTFPDNDVITVPFLYERGKYPIHNVEVRITDNDKPFPQPVR